MIIAATTKVACRTKITAGVTSTAKMKVASDNQATDKIMPPLGVVKFAVMYETNLTPKMFRSQKQKQRRVHPMEVPTS